MHKNSKTILCIKIRKNEYLFKDEFMHKHAEKRIFIFFKKGLQFVALSFTIRITNKAQHVGLKKLKGVLHMKKLQKLNMSVSVVIPKKDNDGKLMNNKVYESTLTLTDIVEGVSIQDMRGMWIEDGLFYQDDNELYKWSFSSENKQFETIIYAFMQLILDLVYHGKQYAVMIGINGVDYLFDRNSQVGDVEDVLIEVRDEVSKNA